MPVEDTSGEGVVNKETRPKEPKKGDDASKKEKTMQNEQHAARCNSHAWNLHQEINKYYHKQSRKYLGDLGYRTGDT